MVTPNQQLAGFTKVHIPYVLLFHAISTPFELFILYISRAGGSVVVSVPILSSQLAVWSLSNSWVVEPGVFAVKVGTSDQIFVTANLTVS